MTGPKNFESPDDDDEERIEIHEGMSAREAMEAYRRYLAKGRPPDIATTRHRVRRNKKKNGSMEPAEILASVMNGPLHAKAREPSVDAAINLAAIEAAKGDLGAAEFLIDKYRHSVKHGEFEIKHKVRYVAPPKGSE